jgi:hypothetical protein
MMKGGRKNFHDPVGQHALEMPEYISITQIPEQFNNRAAVRVGWRHAGDSGQPLIPRSDDETSVSSKYANRMI